MRYNPVSIIEVFGPHKTTHGVRGLNKHYHMWLDRKLGHWIFAISQIPYACSEFTSMLEKPWTRGMPPHQQTHYQPVHDWIYWPLLGSFNKWNIITFLHKAKTIKDFGEIHQFAIDGISNSMASLVQSGKYGALNKTHFTTVGYCVNKLFSEAYTLHEDTTRDCKN